MRRNNSLSEPDLPTKRRLGERESSSFLPKEEPPQISPAHLDSILPTSRNGYVNSTRRAFRALRSENGAPAKDLGRHLRATRSTASSSWHQPLQPRSAIALSGGPPRNLQTRLSRKE